MLLVGIDIGKLNHTFSIMDKDTGEFITENKHFDNTKKGFEKLIETFGSASKEEILIGMEDTGHYHFALVKYLLTREYRLGLINPVITDLQRRLDGCTNKTDHIDSLTICDILYSPERKKKYRMTTVDRYDYYEQKQLTREHHNLKEELNKYKNRLQKCIDLIFPEFNELFSSKYGTVYMNVLRTYGSADAIASTDIRSLRKCFEIEGRGRRIALTAEKLKEAAKESIGISSDSDVLQTKHLVEIIDLIDSQIKEIDKKIEEFSTELNSPIISIPGISHFSGTSILAEIGDINKYDKPSRLIKLAGVAPYEYESSQYRAQHMAITKKGIKYLRKTLYQIITPVIQNNEVFLAYYEHKIKEGKGHRCAQGHCVRKLLRIIYHLLKTNQQFNSEKLV